MSAQRNVIVHYHLFKNAGTSVDHLLKKNFGEQWHGFDGESPGQIITTEELQQTIAKHTDKVAFSSHQIVPPLPEIDGNVFPIVFLRDPIDRIKSAYLFEWKKQLGLEAPKAELSEYVLEKFKFQRKSSIEEFQTIRLSNCDIEAFVSRSFDDDEMLEKACEFISSLPFVGIVDEFDSSMDLLSRYLGSGFPEFQVSEVKANVLQDVSTPIIDKQKKIQQELGDDLYEEIQARNKLDTQLYKFAKRHFRQLKEQADSFNNLNVASGS